MNIEERLQLLEQRVRALEDTLDVLRVVASYGPSVDGGVVAEAGRLWTADCTYDSDNAAEPKPRRPMTLPCNTANSARDSPCCWPPRWGMS